MLKSLVKAKDPTGVDTILNQFSLMTQLISGKFRLCRELYYITDKRKKGEKFLWPE